MKKIIFLSIFIFIFFSLSCQDYPTILQKPDSINVFGHNLIDNYSWLKDKTRSNVEIIKILEQQNEFCDQVMASTIPLQETLYQEYFNRLDLSNESVPVKRDSFFYYNRQIPGEQYYLYCRKKSTLLNDEEIYFNENNQARDYDFFSLYTLRVSPDHKRVAISLDTEGNEEYCLMVYDIDTKVFLQDRIENASDIVWCNDSKMLFYTYHDSTGRSYQIKRHKLGDDPTNDKIVFTEEDPAFFCWIEKSKSNEYFFISTESQVTSGTYYLETDKPTGDFTLFAPQKAGEIYRIFDQGNRFVILSNSDGAVNYKVATAIKNSQNRDNWKSVIPHRENILIDLEIFEDFFVLTEIENGLTNKVILDNNFNRIDTLEVNDEVYSIFSANNPHYHGRYYRYSYETPISPASIYSYDLNSGKRYLLKQRDIPTDFQPENYSVERLFAPSSDGKQIPITLIIPDKIKELSQPAPLLLEAYGAYGDTFSPTYSSSIPSLLNRGFIYAIAHVRGGSENGKNWYEDGKILKKKNTFNDFITCAEFLIESKLTKPELLTAKGGSAGGLLMGVINNDRPDLFKTIIADVPFVDLINSMLDPSLSAIVSEYEEWGNPNIQKEFEYMLSYDPYYQISKQFHPNVLAVTGFYDTRVDYWGPTKWIAKLRENNLGDNLLLLKTDMNSGHGGSSGRFDFYRAIAFEQAFILKTLELDK